MLLLCQIKQLNITDEYSLKLLNTQAATALMGMSIDTAKKYLYFSVGTERKQGIPKRKRKHKQSMVKRFFEKTKTRRDN